MTNRSWIAIGLALVVACALGWWAYKEVQRRELQRQVVSLAQDSTTRLREALGLLTAGAEARSTLEAHFAALEDSVRATEKLDRSLDSELISAAYAYVTDVHALLRRAIALHAGRDAVRSDIGAIQGHLRTAGTRSTEWIAQALALQQRLSASFLDYQLADGGLGKSLDSLHETSPKLGSFVPESAVIGKDELVAAAKQLYQQMTEIEPEIASAKKLPTG
jgi:hypothetical protein